jgi:hypothetical protein
MRHTRISAVALVLSVALTACGEARRVEGSPATFATGAACPEGGTTLRYADFQGPFFGNAAGTSGYCNYCHDSIRTTVEARHGAPPDVTLDQLAVIRVMAARIDAAAGKGPTPTTPVMPFLLPSPKPADVPDPQPVPSDAERERLSEWLACGAP